jgi:hypothetical protein
MTNGAAPGYLAADDCRLADLIDLVSEKTEQAGYPNASAIEQNVVVCGQSSPPGPAVRGGCRTS